MKSKSLAIQSVICFSLILLNFLVQVPYFLHLYAGRQPLAITLRSFAIMTPLFAYFLTAAILLYLRKPAGYWMMVLFLSVEFLFYLFGAFQSVANGLGLFFQVRNPDPVLRIIYSIGYTNLFASAYFLYLLLRYRREYF